MASTATKWLVGCGVGCGLLVLAVVGIVAFGVFVVRDTFKGFAEAIELREELEQRDGDESSFTPWPDGSIPADRLEAFARVREATQPARVAVARTFDALPLNEERARELDAKSNLEKLKGVFSISREALGLGGRIGELFAVRNRALLDEGISLGEYTYLYVITYQSWLELNPEPTPFNVRIDEEVGAVATAGEVVPSGMTATRVRKALLEMVGNQLAALGDDADPEWRARLTAELAALEANRERVPWQDGLPAGSLAALEPFRERLVATWEPLTHNFELARNQQAGSMSIRAD